MAGICRILGIVLLIIGVIGAFMAAFSGNGGFGWLLFNLITSLTSAAIFPVIFFAVAEGLDHLRYLSDMARQREERERRAELNKEE